MASKKKRTAGRTAKTIAQKKAAAKKVNPWCLIRWLALIPLGLIWFVFTFLMAGYSFSALVCLGLMGLCLFYNVMHWAVEKRPKPFRMVRRMVTILLCIGLLVVGITECFIIHASFGNPKESCEYIVVLGAKVRQDGPSVSLMDRIRGAHAYLEANPEVIAIVSGGQGPDEPMTEAACMREQLINLGIDPDRIWLEEKATSTWENLKFSLDLIESETGVRPSKLGVVSSEYHLFRASLFAEACEVDFVGIPARTSRLSQMVNHFMREVAGVWHYILLGGQYHD